LLQVISSINVFMIIISIMTFGLRTSKDFWVYPSNTTVTTYDNDTINGTSVLMTTVKTVSNGLVKAGPSPIFDYIDGATNAWFTVVILVRFAVSPNRYEPNQLI
jgi:hypothetical protein